MFFGECMWIKFNFWDVYVKFCVLWEIFLEEDNLLYMKIN